MTGDSPALAAHLAHLAWLDGLQTGHEVAVVREGSPTRILKVARRTPSGRIVVLHEDGYHQITFRTKDGRQRERSHRFEICSYLKEPDPEIREAVAMRKLRDGTISTLNQRWRELPDAAVRDVAVRDVAAALGAHGY